MSDFDYSEVANKPLTDMSDRMRNWYYMKLMDMANGDKLAGKEFIKGVSELEALWSVDFNSNGDGLILENVKKLAEKHSRKVLEDFINDHFPENSLSPGVRSEELLHKLGHVSTTYAGKYEYTIPDSMYGDIRFKVGGEKKPSFIYNHDPIGRVEVTGDSFMSLSDESIKSALQGAIKAVDDKHLCGTGFFEFEMPPFGKIKVQKWPEFGGKEAVEKEKVIKEYLTKDSLTKGMVTEESRRPKEPVVDDKYGRVYSDLEQDGDKESSAKKYATGINIDKNFIPTPYFKYNHEPIGSVTVTGEEFFELSDKTIINMLKSAIRAVETKHLSGEIDSPAKKRVYAVGITMDNVKGDGYRTAYVSDKPDPRPTDLDEHGCNAEGCYAFGEFLKGVEFVDGGYRWKQQKTEVPRGTVKPTNRPKFNVNDCVYYTNSSGEIQEDKIIVVGTEDYGDGLVYFKYSTPLMFDSFLPESRFYKAKYDLIRDLLLKSNKSAESL